MKIVKAVIMVAMLLMVWRVIDWLELMLDQAMRVSLIWAVLIVPVCVLVLGGWAITIRFLEHTLSKKQ